MGVAGVLMGVRNGVVWMDGVEVWDGVEEIGFGFWEFEKDLCAVVVLWKP